MQLTALFRSYPKMKSTHYLNFFKLKYDDIQPVENIMSADDRKRVYRVLVNNRNAKDHKARELKNVI